MSTQPNRSIFLIKVPPVITKLSGQVLRDTVMRADIAALKALFGVDALRTKDYTVIAFHTIKSLSIC